MILLLLAQRSDNRAASDKRSFIPMGGEHFRKLEPLSEKLVVSSVRFPIAHLESFDAAAISGFPIARIRELLLGSI